MIKPRSSTLMMQTTMLCTARLMCSLPKMKFLWTHNWLRMFKLVRMHRTRKTLFKSISPQSLVQSIIVKTQSPTLSLSFSCFFFGPQTVSQNRINSSRSILFYRISALPLCMLAICSNLDRKLIRISETI